MKFKSTHVVVHGTEIDYACIKKVVYNSDSHRMRITYSTPAGNSQFVAYRVPSANAERLIKIMENQKDETRRFSSPALAEEGVEMDD